ncbi:MAG: LPS-assembly protein LptD [Deltaproteobacteria bacterium]|nr:LPS-assembly protein LptD [Deltaproteobacteria bacterium]
MKGSGGVVVSRGGIQVQANDALVNMETKDASFDGNVVVTDNQGTLNAKSGNLNLDSETGKFSDTQFTYEEGLLDIQAGEIEKLSETEFEMRNTTMSTCQCADDQRPWSLHSSRAHITQEGYAHTYNTWMDFHGVPIFYTPYLAFPVKRERQSGLLAPDFGYSRENGFLARIPVYGVINDSSDITITPFIQTQSRIGSSFDYRQVFSRYNRVRSRLLYSDDARRGPNNLQGTNTDGVYDPNYKENRFGYYYGQEWTSAPDADHNSAFLADIHYVNDDLFLREMDDETIGVYNSRYATSTVLARTSVGDVGTAELSGEYNQSFYSDPDQTFQRLPEASLTGMKSFRAFGSNPYGLKLVTQGGLYATDFVRSEGYDGWRFNATPRIGVPFHVQNYVNGQMDFLVDSAQYKLRDTTVPGSSPEENLDSSQDRRIYAFSYRMGTGVERVYQLEKDNWLTWVTSLGQQNQDNKLVRLKHTVEPFMSYTHVPDVDQDDLPLFDSRDRIRARKLLTYGFRSNLYGRFLSDRPGRDTISELTPQVEDLPLLDMDRPIGDIDGIDQAETFGGGNVSIRPGEVRPIVSFGAKQNYDFEQTDDSDPDDNLEPRPLSDVNSDVTFFPSNNFALRFENNYSTYNQNFSSWASSLIFNDDRGDSIRARYSFVENNPDQGDDSGVSQLETNAELKVSQQLRLGYYGRYDNQAKQFIESRGGVRLYSTCNCWHFDFAVGNRVNPDTQYVNVSFTFSGLGSVGQKIGYGGDGPGGGS